VLQSLDDAARCEPVYASYMANRRESDSLDSHRAAAFDASGLANGWICYTSRSGRAVALQTRITQPSNEVSRV